MLTSFLELIYNLIMAYIFECDGPSGHPLYRIRVVTLSNLGRDI